MTININRYILYILFYSLISLISCAPRAVHNIKYAKDLAQAERLMQRGETKQAAAVYQRLAEKQSRDQNQFRILAADSLLKSGNSTTAKTYADAINSTKLTEHQRQQLNLLYAEINLHDGEAEQAINRLNLITVKRLNKADKISFHQAKAFAFSLTSDLLGSVEQRILLRKILQDPDLLNDNYTAILETLSILSPAYLKKSLPNTSPELQGWITLTLVLNKNFQDEAEFNTALNNWQNTFPKHPANSNFLDAYLATPPLSFKRPNSIAILLPETGPYAQAARAVREGFMAAYYHQEDRSFKPSIRFYDSESTTIFSLYNQAIAEGAELIIGPLNKAKIEQLVAHTELRIPVLALNHVPDLYHPKIYQFGLSPIDEVEQIVSKAWFDGKEKVLLLMPESGLGRRIRNYFTAAWEEIDGVILETQTFNPKQSDYSLPIKKLLNLDESEHRYKKIRKFIPQVKFNPRRRHDVDAIFLSGYPQSSRLLNPQLRFYRASRIPVYATPHVYSGRPNPAQDIDLNGISFCDIPWLYEDAYQGELSLESLSRSWKQFPSIYLRLIALGIDAYDLVPHLDKLDTIRYQGTTGGLLLTESNRIKRNLLCAKFTQGSPQITSSAANSAQGYESIAKMPKSAKYSDHEQ